MGILQAEPGAARSAHATFVVRVWLEPAGSGGPAAEHQEASALRGSVQEVGHETLRYFASLDAMQAIIAGIVGAPSVPRGADHPPPAGRPAELTR